MSNRDVFHIEWAMFRGMLRVLILSMLEKSRMRGYQIV